MLCHMQVHVICAGILYLVSTVHTMDDEVRKGSFVGKKRPQNFRWFTAPIAIFLADRMWRYLTGVRCRWSSCRECAVRIYVIRILPLLGCGAACGAVFVESVLLHDLCWSLQYCMVAATRRAALSLIPLRSTPAGKQRAGSSIEHPAR